MKRLHVWIAGGLLTLCLLPGAASAMGVELSVGGWNQNPSGDVSYKATSGQDNLSIKDDLKYSDESKIFGRIKIEPPLLFPNIYLMATPMKFSETGSKNSSFRFGDVTYAANVPFTSELRLDHYDVGFYYGLPALKTVTAGILNVDLGIGARIFDFKTWVTGQDSVSGLTITDSQSLVTAMPMGYLGFQIKPVKWIAAEGEARGIIYDGDNHYYDLIGRVKLKPFGPLFAAVGYRYEKVKFDRYDVKADASFGGPFGEIGVEF